MTRETLLLLDFDGTLCLGDDPVLFYAEQADRLLEGKGLGLPGGGIRGVVVRAFEQNTLLAPEILYNDAGFPLGVDQEPVRAARSGKAHPASWPLQDGYQLVQLLAVQSGLSDEEAGIAFQEGRKALLSRGLEHSDVHAPSGARDFLARVREEAAVGLITNSPADAFGPWLEHLGLAGSFDAVVNGAQKPFGMPAAVKAAQEQAGVTVQPSRMVSVGDIWRNDLEHVDALGGTTVLIDRFSTGLGNPTQRVSGWGEAASSLEGLTLVNIE